MLIQCTKKLLDQLNIKPTIKEEQPLFSWHANLITVNRRKTVVLCNNSSRYILVLHGLKAKEFKKLDDLIIEAIRETLLDECIKPEIVKQFIKQAPGIFYTKTKGGSLVARMNKACDIVHRFADIFANDTLNQSRVSSRANRYIFSDRNNNYVQPNESLYKDLEDFTKKPIFSCKTIQLKITLNLENHEVWRKVVVPVNITFDDLHDIIQIVFGWQDYHLHEFYIFDGNKPIVNLVCSEEAFEYPNEVPMIIETGVKLSEYLLKYSRIKYTYDFGDNWEHYIVVEKIIDDYPKNYLKCIAGKGNTPPEDVGGEGGYEDFLEAINDPKHPEHEDMLVWGNSQRYKDFDMEYVNRILKYVLNGYR